MAKTVYLLLGSNLGDREHFLASALNELESVEGLEIIATSPVYITEPMGVKDEQPSFLNQVVKAEYAFNSGELLATTEMIEAKLGRTNKGGMQPRTIDIDILLFGTEKINTAKLTVPHPRLLERPFAMVPLVEIDPELVHPETSKPIADYLTDTDKKKVILYQDHVARLV